MKSRNDKARMTNVEGMTKLKMRAQHGHLVIRHFAIVSSFVIWISSLS